MQTEKGAGEGESESSRARVGAKQQGSGKGGAGNVGLRRTSTPLWFVFFRKFYSWFFFPYFRTDERVIGCLFVCRRRVKTINVFNGAADVLGRWEKEWNTEQCTVHLRLE